MIWKLAHSVLVILFVLGGRNLAISDEFAVTSDDTSLSALRAEATNLRQLADMAKWGRQIDPRLTSSWEKQADLMMEEARLRTDHTEILKAIALLKKEGMDKDANRLQIISEDLLARANSKRIEIKETAILEEQSRRIRTRITQNAKKASYLRRNGQFEEANEIEADIKALLADADPDIQRANRLKEQAVQWRLDKRHRDAELLEAEADRLLKIYRERYRVEPDEFIENETR